MLQFNFIHYGPTGPVSGYSSHFLNLLHFSRSKLLCFIQSECKQIKSLSPWKGREAFAVPPYFGWSLFYIENQLLFTGTEFTHIPGTVTLPLASKPTFPYRKDFRSAAPRSIQFLRRYRLSPAPTLLTSLEIYYSCSQPLRLQLIIIRR